VDAAIVFVSHALACSFLSLLDAVESFLAMHDLRKAHTYLWLDMFWCAPPDRFRREQPRKHSRARRFCPIRAP
jgi:hypothetical protein